jgi:hypothetical protein
MWHEAKKQEKLNRSIMSDHKKRAERKKEYYDKIVTSFFCSDFYIIL